MVDKFSKQELSLRLRGVLEELEKVTTDLAIVGDEILITYLEVTEEDGLPRN